MRVLNRWTLTPLLAGLLALTTLSGSWAQEEPARLPPAPEDDTPVLPEVPVEATPPPETPPATTTPQPSQFNPPITSPDQVFDPVIDGTRFSSPVADGYLAPSSTTGTIINVPDADIPGTVNVIPPAVIEDQLTLDFTDIARNAGGITSGGDSLFADRLLLRGLELDSRDFRRDGFLDPTFVPRDFQTIERVEILKGPASVLYGPGSPAGLVNLISKQPFNDQFTDFGFTFGSFGLQRYTLDHNNRATESGNVLYRINLAFEDTDSFRDFVYDRRQLIAPGVTWIIDHDTRLTYLAEWHQDKRRGDQGIPAINGDPFAVPQDRYVGEPANDGLNFEEFRQSLVLTHDLSKDWTLQIGAQTLWYEYPGSVTAAFTNPFPNPDIFLRTRNDILKADEQSHSLRANVAGEFEWLQLNHEAVFGLEYIYFQSDTTFAFGILPPVNVQDPPYNDPPDLTLFTAEFPVFQQHRFGIFMQDLIELTPKWKLLGGVRFDTVDFQFERNLLVGPFDIPFESDQTFNRVSPRAGIIFQPLENDDLSLYFNYSRSFTPPGGGIYLNTDPLKPILGQGYEIGIKSELVEGLTLNVAGFYATRENADISTMSFVLMQVGEERTQGVEVNLIGEITERWNVIGNYTYADTRLSDPDNPDIDGSRQRNVPFNSFNVWSRYNFIQDRLQTMGLALGMIYQGDRAADFENTVTLPSFVRWDGGLYYRRGCFDASLYAENLFDIQYAARSINAEQIYPGAPANLRAQIGVVF